MTTPATIRKGSRGPDVARWQAILVRDGVVSDDGKPVAVDGDFGKRTEEATRTWQKQRKLLTDGVVGQSTWGLALDVPFDPAAPLPGGSVGAHMAQEGVSAAPVANADAAAYALAKRAAPTLTEAERQYALTVARGESFYGKGWKGEGAGSKNWGAVQGTGPAGSFGNTDHHADGTPYKGTFKRYQTDEQGFLDVVRILLKDNVREALARGSLRDAVFAQHANRYFELAPEKYLAAVLRNHATAAKNTGWPDVLSETGAASVVATVAKGGALGAVAVLVGLGALLWWSRS